MDSDSESEGDGVEQQDGDYEGSDEEEDGDDEPLTAHAKRQQAKAAKAAETSRFNTLLDAIDITEAELRGDASPRNSGDSSSSQGGSGTSKGAPSSSRAAPSSSQPPASKTPATGKGKGKENKGTPATGSKNKADGPPDGEAAPKRANTCHSRGAWASGGQRSAW